MPPIEKRSEFLSEEDLDLQTLPAEEFYAWWNWRLRLAQCTNDLDAHHYSHGVFADNPLGLPPFADDAVCRGPAPRDLARRRDDYRYGKTE